MVRPAMTGRGAISFFFFCIIPSTIVFRAGITSFRARYIIPCALRHSVLDTESPTMTEAYMEIAGQSPQ